MSYRKVGVLLASICLLAGAPVALAQEKKEGPPQPGPEHKKLQYFVGTWKSEGDTKENPMMPAGKFTSTDKCEWFEGGFAVVCHSTGKMPTGPMKGLGIISYHPGEKVYTYAGVDSMGMGGYSKGTVEGKVWTFQAEDVMEGKTWHSRYTITETSPTAYTFKFEMSGDGQKYDLIMEGTSTRTGK
jgi:hypothetical protein